MNRPNRDYLFYRDRILVMAQLERASGIEAVRSPLRRIALASLRTTNVRFQDLRDAASGHPEFEALLAAPPGRVEHVERTKAGTWRYLKDAATSDPTWAIRVFKSPGTIPFEDRIPDDAPPPAPKPRYRIPKTIQASEAAPARPPTAKQLEAKIDALRRVITAWARRHKIDPGNFSFCTFEENYGNPVEYFSNVENPGVASAIGLHRDGTMTYERGDGPCVLLFFVDGDAYRALERGRSDTFEEFSAMIDATQFQFDFYTGFELWFFAEPEWLIDAYTRYYSTGEERPSASVVGADEQP